jgi:regulator of replication initiation timing
MQVDVFENEHIIKLNREISYLKETIKALSNDNKHLKLLLSLSNTLEEVANSNSADSNALYQHSKQKIATLERSTNKNAVDLNILYQHNQQILTDKNETDQENTMLLEQIKIASIQNSNLSMEIKRLMKEELQLDALEPLYAKQIQRVVPQQLESIKSFINIFFKDSTDAKKKGIASECVIGNTNQTANRSRENKGW